MLTKDARSIVLLFAFLLLSPVIEPGGARINFAEFYIYINFIINSKNIVRNRYFHILTIASFGFLFVCLFSSLLAGSVLNSHDIFMLRLMVQTAMVCSILNYRLTRVMEEGKDQFSLLLYRLIVVGFIPAVVVILQKINIFGFRSIITRIYTPKFFFTSGDVFSSFRYTSIFKDFYTAAIYFILFSFLCFYYINKVDSSKKAKIHVLIILVITFVIQTMVARTSLLFIPVVLISAFLLAKGKKLASKFRGILLFTFVLGPLGYLGINLLLDAGLVNKSWVLVALDIFSDKGSESSSSLTTLLEWNEGFFKSLNQRPLILIRPKHEFKLNVLTSKSYSDSFYVQEIYRYGIYGMILYFGYMSALAKKLYSDCREAVVIIAVFIILNYKGGNVVFMPKVIYLFALILVFLPFHEKLYTSKMMGEKEGS
ncbi:hypothetical protein [Halobacteriovorax sp. HLS]|uniref:hypothetical protein n=1 Tax=Halobacteriovorax sp. HLS TaxID=2234000 RepID=UPI000FD77A4B|nr:hypothetical protein [Halobacteriovorax sp. HLS]